MPVGDVNSTERGSGARYNDGKPNLALIPTYIFSAFVESFSKNSTIAANPAARACQALNSLAAFQQSDSSFHLNEALLALDFPMRNAARVFEYGSKKYAMWNWAKGMAWSIPAACFMRHAAALIEGEIDDPESGLPHEGHMACNLIMLIHYVHYFEEGNDFTFAAILPPNK